MSSTHDEEAPQKLLRVVVYTTLSRTLGVQGIYRASISNICSAVAGTAYVVCAEPFILWLPRLQSCLGTERVYTAVVKLYSSCMSAMHVLVSVPLHVFIRKLEVMLPLTHKPVNNSCGVFRRFLKVRLSPCLKEQN